MAGIAVSSGPRGSLPRTGRAPSAARIAGVLGLGGRHVLRINERERPTYADEDPDDWWIRDIGVPTDHEVGDLADAASGGVEDATAEQVGQRDRLVGDSPTSSDPIVQSG